MSHKDVCNCLCHTHKDINVNHFGPCCRTCTVCRKNIKIDFYNIHVANCEDVFEIGIALGISDIKNETFDEMVRRKKDEYMRGIFE